VCQLGSTSPPPGPAALPLSGDGWVTVTVAELDVVVRAIGAGLVALGIEPEDRVAIASSTRYEWALADLAVMVAGGATTTIYPTTMADDVAFILSDSGTKVIFAENSEQLEKLRGIRASTPAVTRVIVFDGAVLQRQEVLRAQQPGKSRSVRIPEERLGVRPMMRALASALVSTAARASSVAMVPGATALTRMPRATSASDIARVSWLIAPLLAL